MTEVHTLLILLVKFFFLVKVILETLKDMGTVLPFQKSVDTASRPHVFPNQTDNGGAAVKRI